MLPLSRLTAALFVLPLVLVTPGCTATDATQTIAVALQKGQTYEYRTVGGDEEGATIVVHPMHFAISEIRRGPATNWVAVYVYQPAAGFVGSDYAELQVLTGSDGASPPAAKKVAIRFVVQE